MEEIYRELFDELETCRQEVALIPAPDQRHSGHMVRIAVSWNPDWYRDLCASYPSRRKRARRKSDTRVKRRSILQALRRLAAGLESRSLYAADLVAIADSRFVPF